MIKSVAVAVLVGSVMIMLGACTTVRPPVDEPSPVAPSSTEPPVYAGPGQPNLKADRVWSSVLDGPLAKVVALADDGVVVADGAGGLLAIGSDGKRRWSWNRRSTLKVSDKYPEATVISEFGRTVDSGAKQVVVAAYQSHGEPECRRRPKGCGYDEQPHLGLVALSAEDGTPVWSTRLEPDLPSDEDPWQISYRVKVVTDTVALIEVVPDLHDKKGKLLRVPLTVALDAKTGDQLWAQRGLEVDRASGDRVLARRPAGKDEQGRPELLDARTGQRLWAGSAPGSWSPSGWAGDLHGYGVAVLNPNGGAKFQVIDLASGRPVPDARAEHGTVVGRDERAPFLAHREADRDDRYTLVTAELPGGTGQRGQHQLPREVLRGHLLAAAGPYLWLHHGADPQTTLAVDRTGAQRLSTVPGQIAAVDENWLVTAEARKVTIYRLSRGPGDR